MPQMTRNRKRPKPKGGRRPGVKMPCGWGCGEAFTATEIREHFTNCPKRPDPKTHMTVTVLIHRQTREETSPGTIRAYALGNGRDRGKNLLAPGTKDIEAAKTRAREAITDELAKMNLPAPEFQWIIEDWKTDPLKIKTEGEAK